MYARIFRAGLCWDGGEKGGAWHLKALLFCAMMIPFGCLAQSKET